MLKSQQINFSKGLSIHNIVIGGVGGGVKLIQNFANERGKGGVSEMLTRASKS